MVEQGIEVIQLITELIVTWEMKDKNERKPISLKRTRRLEIKSRYHPSFSSGFLLLLLLIPKNKKKGLMLGGKLYQEVI